MPPFLARELVINGDITLIIKACFFEKGIIAFLFVVTLLAGKLQKQQLQRYGL